MNTIPVNYKSSYESKNNFLQSGLDSGYLMNNLIIEKKVSLNWLYKLYRNSILYDFILLFTSPVI